MADAQQAILQATANGELLLDEAEALSGLLEAPREAFETQELEQRIATLEGKRPIGAAFCRPIVIYKLTSLLSSLTTSFSGMRGDGTTNSYRCGASSSLV